MAAEDPVTQDSSTTMVLTKFYRNNQGLESEGWLNHRGQVTHLSH